MLPNFYRVLHVQPDAPVEIIRTSYRTLMRTYAQHPDLGGDTAAAALINEAYETLKDPRRRCAYDRALELEKEAAGDRAVSNPAPGPRSAAAPVSRKQPDPETPACLFCGEPHLELDRQRPEAGCARCGTPLCAVPAWARSTASRRGLHRTLLVMHVTCRLQGASQSFDAVSEDLSVGGLRLASATELQVGQVVSLDCDFCSAVGIVRHSVPATRGARRWWQAGIEFKTVRLKQMRGGLVSASA